MNHHLNRHDSPESDDDSFASRQEVEHELLRIRRQASVAKLEARAAELERILARIDAGETIPMSQVVGDMQDWDLDAHRFDKETLVREDAAHATPSAPRMRRNPVGPDDSSVPDDVQRPVVVDDVAPKAKTNPSISEAPKSKKLPGKLSGRLPDKLSEKPTQVALVPTAVDASNLDEEPARRRRSPMALFISAAVHVVFVILLAAWTLSNSFPKDQVALSASTTSSEESAMETFAITSDQPITDPTQSQPDETQYDLSPVGELAAVEVNPDVMSDMPAPPAPMQALSGAAASLASAAMKSLKSDSKSKTQFCGVEGGGSHFVYLVDSSGSMGDAFDSARQALLESIDLLDSKQRFYVIFFDAECDFMRLFNPDQDEPRSVYATPDNKRRLKTWASKISKDRGKAPYDPLKFALGLKPDVIFLLSDGEFPEGIFNLLSEENHVTNLFGDEGKISIVHTIGYYSEEGEEIMSRIAKANGGQYRHVPKP